MIVYSIDIETTGLDPERNQVLEIGVARGEIYDDSPLDTWHLYVDHDELYVNPFALNMNRDLLQEMFELKQTNSTRLVSPDKVFPLFKKWQTSIYEPNPTRLIACGRNFNGFDLQFLKRLGFVNLFRHRVIDPTVLYMRRGDEYPPSLDEAAERAGLPPRISHRAIDDAIQSIWCVRSHFGQCVIF